MTYSADPWHRRLATGGTWNHNLSQLSDTNAERPIDWTVAVDSTAAASEILDTRQLRLENFIILPEIIDCLFRLIDLSL